jgi:hypothetical protein
MEYFATVGRRVKRLQEWWIERESVLFRHVGGADPWEA